MGGAYQQRARRRPLRTCSAQTIQPLQDDEDGAHYEILLRMRDESGSIIAPGLFIEAAERYSITPSIDRWVIRNCVSLAGIGSGRAGAPVAVFDQPVRCRAWATKNSCRSSSNSSR